MAMQKIKVNDIVRIMAGKDKGKEGKVMQVFPREERVVVDGVNKMYKHIRSPRRGEKGQRIEFFGPLHLSNVQLVAEKAKSVGRVGFIGQGQDKKRVIRKAGKIIE